MRFSICLVFILHLAFSKDVRHKIQNPNQQSGNYISLIGGASNSQNVFEGSRSTRDDSRCQQRSVGLCWMARRRHHRRGAYRMLAAHVSLLDGE